MLGYLCLHQQHITVCFKKGDHEELLVNLWLSIVPPATIPEQSARGNQF